jgi:RimJ/RimL family protein N-acetyltransferase
VATVAERVTGNEYFVAALLLRYVPMALWQTEVWREGCELTTNRCVMDDPKRLRGHGVVLRGERVVLRPMTGGDWPVLLRWNQDPEVLAYSEGDDVAAYTLDEVQAIYRGVCRRAFCFIIEIGPAGARRPIGECWLQQMNLARILTRFPGEDLRRIDLMIGEKALWGRGYGTEVIGLVTTFAFRDQSADRVFGCDIADYNPASLRAFRKNGYRVLNEIPQPAGSKAAVVCDVVR